MTWLSSDAAVYLSNVAGNADWTGAWVQCSPGSLLVFQASWTAVALTAGALEVQGTQDPAFAAANVITLPLTTGIWGAWPTVGPTADTAAVIIKNPMLFHRMRYVYGGTGGGANQFNAWRELRS